MKIKRHILKRPSAIIVLCLILSGLLLGAVFAFYRHSEPPQSDVSDKPTVAKKDEHLGSTTQKVSDEPANQTPPDSNTPNAVKRNASGALSDTTSQETTATPQTTAPHAQVASCNEAMKTAYTSRYDAQVTAEYARRGALANQIRDEARGNGAGGSFSGIVQDKLNQAESLHQANLATINSEYQANLASINCN